VEARRVLWRSVADADEATRAAVHTVIEWTDWSEDYLARHGITPGEVEEVLFTRPRWTAKGRENTTLVYGSTAVGRLMLVVAVDEEDGWHSSLRRWTRSGSTGGWDRRGGEHDDDAP